MMSMATDSQSSNDVMLTTLDNPWDPFTRFDDWYAFDEQAGYHTCGLLARFTISSDELAEVDQELAIVEAMREIIEINPTGNYKLVRAEDKN